MWTCKTLSVILDVIVHITNGSIRNSDPRLRSVFFHGFNSNFDSELEVLIARRDFQDRSNSRVSLNPSFRFRSLDRLEVGCIRDKLLISAEIH